jgi:hypothetical protein
MKYRRIVACLLGLAASPVYAQPLPKPAPINGTYAELKKEYDGAIKKFQEEQEKALMDVKKELVDETNAAEKALRVAKTIEEKAAARKELQAVATKAAMKIHRPDNPVAKFSVRFLEFAERNPHDGSAFESIVLALRTSGGINGKAVGPAIKNLQTYHVANPGIKKVLQLLDGAPFDEGIEKLVREIMLRNPSRKIQALACKQLTTGLNALKKIQPRAHTLSECWARTVSRG